MRSAIARRTIYCPAMQTLPTSNQGCQTLLAPPQEAAKSQTARCVFWPIWGGGIKTFTFMRLWGEFSPMAGKGWFLLLFISQKVWKCWKSGLGHKHSFRESWPSRGEKVAGRRASPKFWVSTFFGPGVKVWQTRVAAAFSWIIREQTLLLWRMGEVTQQCLNFVNCQSYFLCVRARLTLALP